MAKYTIVYGVSFGSIPDQPVPRFARFETEDLEKTLTEYDGRVDSDTSKREGWFVFKGWPSLVGETEE